MERSSVTPSKIVSLVLGIVIVTIVFILIAGRLRLSERVAKLSGRNIGPSPTAKLTPMPTIIIIDKNTDQIKYEEKGGVVKQKATAKKPTAEATYNKASTIPNAGVPTLFLPTALSALFTGIYLRRKS